jgi:hypothetical protein
LVRCDKPSRLLELRVSPQLLDDLPFDFDHHRISRYKMADEISDIRAKENDLGSLLKVAVEHILLEQPKRPRELEGKSDEEIKRARDLENIKSFLSQFSVTRMDEHIMEMPEKLHYFAAHMHDDMRRVVESSDFRLYDKDIESRMLAVYNSLGKTLQYDQFYSELKNGWVQHFEHREKYRYEGAPEAAKELDDAIKELRSTLSLLIQMIREKYIEIDLDETSQIAADRYDKLVGKSSR